MASNLFTTRVRTLSEREVRGAACQLYDLICSGFEPQLLLGIRRGGYVVAEHMKAAAATSAVMLLPVSRYRLSTIRKNKRAVVQTLIRNLPEPVCDGLRILEHAILTQQRRLLTNPFVPDQAEVASIQSFLSAKTGVTLAGILALLRAAAPNAVVRTAAIVITTNQPLVEPDYSLYRHELCRFPWSLDFKSRPSTHI